MMAFNDNAGKQTRENGRETSDALTDKQYMVQAGHKLSGSDKEFIQMKSF